MGKTDVQIFQEEGFQGLPLIIFVPDLFAAGADGQETGFVIRRRF